MKVSLKDLAEICGCSVTSVSRALKNSDTISKELREKVQAKAQEMGYVPNMLAGSMRTGYTNTIAVILPDLRNPFFALISNYLEEYASSKGYVLFFMTTNENSEREYNAVVSAIQRNVDGILLLPNQQDTKSIELMQKTNFPFVLFARKFEDIKANYVLANDEKGAYQVVRHMIERGHKRILFLNSFLNICSSVYRLNGMKTAMEESGLPFYKKDMAIVSTRMGDTAKMVKRIFGKKNGYTAIFCYCDVIAFEAMYTLTGMGYSVPGDLAIGGVDDIQADITFPVRLTSAGTYRKEYAQKALDMLIDTIHSPITDGSGYRTIIVDSHLTVGDTT